MSSAADRSLFSRLEQIDRRFIYLFVAISLSLPLLLRVSLKPAPMETAGAFFKTVERMEPQPGKIVLIAMDWGPGTSAENGPQTMVAMEHLMRKRIPFAVTTLYTLGVPFLEEVPRRVAERLEKEHPGERWVYGRDWVNLGFLPAGSLTIQGIAKADDIKEYLKTDAKSTPLVDLPAMQGVKTIADVQLLMQFTGLVGTFNAWVQFFSGPPFLHGCTSVTIPEAFIYYSSGQIEGFFEGLAGAARYEVLLNEKFANRTQDGIALRTNTGVSFAQIVVLFFIILGNTGLVVNRFKKARER